MHRIVWAMLAIVVALAESPRSASADGAILPIDASLGYLVVRYHHVTVDIDDLHAVTRVEQEFYNPYTSPVTGRYLFPVPPGAALARFQATVDGQAQATIRQDVAATNRVLYEQVANRRDPRLLQYVDWETIAFDLTVPAHSARRMSLEYEEVLQPAGGMYRYHYVLSTESYTSQPLQSVSLTMNLRSSSGLANIYSSTHPVTVERIGAGQARVAWTAQDVTPAEDFDLFFSTPNGGYGAGLLAGRRNDQDHFLFLFAPQPGSAETGYLPKDIVFVLDRSGSMAGEKIGQAQNALKYFLGRLGESDRFTILSFNTEVSELSPTLQSPSPQTLEAARRYVESLAGNGNTDLDAALQRGLRALAQSPARESATRLLVFLTDGLPTAGVIDAEEIVRRATGANSELAARLHVFGVGYDVNTHLLDRLSADNGGTVTYVQPGENLETVLTGFYDRIAHPVLTGVTVTFEGVQTDALYPATLPDLFEGSSLMLAGRFQGNTDTIRVRVRGQAAGQAREYVYAFKMDQVSGHDFVPRLWATRRVGDLLDRVRVSGENPDLVGEVRELGLGYGIVTPYTGSIIAAQSSGAASTANMGLYQNQKALNRASGEVTIQARVQNQAYQAAEQANLASGANIVNQRQYSVAQFGAPLGGGLNVDLGLLQKRQDPAQPVTPDWVRRNVTVNRTVEFGSEQYFELARDPEVRPLLQAGINVIFPYRGQVIEVRGQDNADGAPSPRQTAPGQPGEPIGQALLRIWSDISAVLDHMAQQALR